ncbi:putative glycosyltransferase family 28 protein [Trypanosoma vivax]|nr:putative glycosyltransferase family 28 protein [Trypanosoma vivax]
MSLPCLTLVLITILALAWRFLYVLRGPPAPKHRSRDAPLSVCVVLGTGGHTCEMMRTIYALKPAVWRANRPFYVVSDTDHHSGSLAKEFEQSKFRRYCLLHRIPRAREVGQSYFFSIFSSLRALWSCMFLIAQEKPDVILANGPGVCVPVVLAAFLLAMFTPSRFYRRPAIGFIETYSSVTHLSVTGKLLAPFSDVFIVQWRVLYNICCNKWWMSKNSLFFVGTNDSLAGSNVPQLLAQEYPSTSLFLPRVNLNNTGSDGGNGSGLMALVTVGSTQFNALVEAMDSEDVCWALAQRGINRLLIQKGSSSHVNTVRSAHGVSIEVFDYRPNLKEVIASAALVISHAGAGTVLEVLEAKKPLIAVPNRSLMLDHQLEFAEALDANRYLRCVQVCDLRRELMELDLSKLRVFPGSNVADLREALALLFSS